MTKQLHCLRCDVAFTEDAEHWGWQRNNKVAFYQEVKPTNNLTSIKVRKESENFLDIICIPQTKAGYQAILQGKNLGQETQQELH